MNHWNLEWSWGPSNSWSTSEISVISGISCTLPVSYSVHQAEMVSEEPDNPVMSNSPSDLQQHPLPHLGAFALASAFLGVPLLTFIIDCSFSFATHCLRSHLLSETSTPHSDYMFAFLFSQDLVHTSNVHLSDFNTHTPEAFVLFLFKSIYPWQDFIKLQF